MSNSFIFKIILTSLIFITNTNYASVSSRPIKEYNRSCTFSNNNNKSIRSLVNSAPEITAIGNQIYCPGTAVKIVTDVTITHDPLELGTYNINIQISEGYDLNGQDKLTLTNQILHPTITSQWNVSEGKLTLSSPIGVLVTYANFVAAIKDVVFSNSSTNPSGIRKFSINLGIGKTSYLPRNGHFYEYFSEFGITWTKARADADNKTYYGLKGYLATLTAADETQLAGAQAPGAGWIGGSDAENEGVWKWVTGPEAGTTFWRGLVGGSTTFPDNFAFWNTNEPNQYNGAQENYAHITAPGVGKPGSWNDLTNTGDRNGDYQPKGYIVEYGGTPQDPQLKISASTTITIAQITNIVPSTRCGTGNITLQATTAGGTIRWYDSASGGTPLETGNSFTTTIASTTTFYAEAGTCESTRKAVIATVNPLPALLLIVVSSTSPVLYCQNETPIPLSATPSLNCRLNWYTSPNGGTANSANPTPSTTATGTISYYVSQTNTLTGCEGARSEIIVIVNPRPVAPLVNNINYCQNETALTLSVTPSPNCSLNWYTLSTGGTSTQTNPTPSTATVGLTSYYVSQTIATTGCEGPRSEIIVTVNPRPTAPVANDGGYCQNEIALPLSVTPSPNCSLNWYTTPTEGTANSTNPTPSTSTVGLTSYYVSQTMTTTGCEGPRTKIIITITPIPLVRNITIIQCDTDLISDGRTLFDLTVNNDVISTNYTNETFTYYGSLNGADEALEPDLILNKLAFENTATSMEVWTRVVNNTTGCHSVAKITLQVPATNIDPNYKIIIPPVCDDFLDTNGNNTTNNNNRDGIATFDLTSSQAIIQEALPTTDTYNINYYKNRPDALAELNAITNITNYRNIGYRDSQDIWVRVESNIDNSCFALGPFLNLVVEMLPIANAVTIPRQCDDNQDGIVTFDTSTLEASLVKDQTNVKVTYFDQNAAPLKDSNGVLITSPFPANFSTTSQTIKAVLTNNSTLGCSDETTIAFIVDASPSAFSIPAALTTACDDELNPVDQDGKFAFDTALFEATILGDQTGMTVSYFDQNGTKLDSPLPNPFVTGTQNISVSVENAENAVCIATTIIPFVVNRIPNIDLNLDGMANELVCSNLPSFFVTLDAGILDNASTSDYNYIWKKDGIDLTTDSPTLGVNNVGVYTVEVINNSGCSRTRTITVNASNVATVDSIDIIDLTDTNSITVNTTGPGDYEYSLDDSANFWQDSNFFDNVSAGAHIVFINDKNGCGIITREIVVVGIPKYFTPNNDSFNDGWGIKGMTKYPNATINIFDRYGKQITTLTISNQTWDGTSNGKPLPTSDYWYVITLDKNSPTIRGHFSLKR